MSFRPGDRSLTHSRKYQAYGRTRSLWVAFCLGGLSALSFIYPSIHPPERGPAQATVRISLALRPTNADRAPARRVSQSLTHSLTSFTHTETAGAAGRLHCSRRVITSGGHAVRGRSKNQAGLKFARGTWQGDITTKETLPRFARQLPSLVLCGRGPSAAPGPRAKR